MMFQIAKLPGWPALKRFLAIVTVGAALLALGACGSREQPAATAVPAAVTAETGGMSLAAPAGGTTVAVPATEGTTVTEEDRAATETGADIPAAEQADIAPAAETPVLGAGETITAGSRLSVYAEADPTSPRFAQYEAGTVFAVVEAGGDYRAYPVEVDGQRWYRVRAPDGLVGWVPEP